MRITTMSHVSDTPGLNCSISKEDGREVDECKQYLEGKTGKTR